MSAESSPEPVASPARSRILDAAEVRLLERGPQGLVLAAVAADAGVSKGGLLYHFPSKDALADGLLERMLAGFDRELEALCAADEAAPGRFCRAWLGTTVDADGSPANHSARLMAGLLAMLGHAPERLAPLRERFEAWHRRIEEDGIDPATALIVRLAADGLWLSALLGLPAPPSALQRSVLARLDGLSRGDG